MTKQFCDLCGQPAGNYPSVAVKHGEPWHGYRVTRDCSGHEGFHQPKVAVCVSFRTEAFQTVSDNATPDLCGDCMYQLLDKLTRSLIPQLPCTPVSL